MMPNLLGYTLLQMIARESTNGYELVHRLRIMQNTHHSQIYPALSKLEEDGYLTVHRQAQEKLPDKKIYAITEKGIDALAEWSETPLKNPVTKDEFIIKLQLDWVNKIRTESLLKERQTYLEEQLEMVDETLHHFEKLLHLDTDAARQADMPYQVYARKRELLVVELEWCERMLANRAN
ncbi:PadR family transcriptional regulator [Listeria grayi]|nr:PadR family transcriptional regulator [Listeria grayi]